MRLVDREQRDVGPVEELSGRVHAQPLGGQIQEVELAREERRLDPHALRAVLRRVEERGAHSEGGQGIHLVLHERDERRDDDARAGANEGGDLVAQRLAAAGRHEHESVAARDDLLDDLGLLAAERVIAEDTVQDLERVRARGGGRVDCAHGVTAP